MKRTAISEQSKERRTEPHLELQLLQQEVQRQRHDLDAVESMLTEQMRALEALKAQMAVVVGSWRSDVSRDLGSLIRAIDSVNDTRTHWDQLRRHVETAAPQPAMNAAEERADLTPFEKNVWMLTEMKLTTSEIAAVLNQPVGAIAECREQIARRLQHGADEPVDTVRAAELDSAATRSSRRQATARGRR